LPRSILTAVVRTHTPELFLAAVKKAAELLRRGELVALPTETVYGLAANALDEKAVSRIFQIKGRPEHNPVIVHVASLELAKACVANWPPLAEKLARAFWPGPLTLVLPRSNTIPEIVTAGGATVGIRWPSHPFIQEIIRECAFPLAAPSANPAGGLSPTNAEHVRKHFGTRIPLIVDGGPSQVGIESTVVDLSVSPARVLRPGMIGEQALLAVTEELAVGGSSGEALKSPGQLRRHYSPKAKLVTFSWRDEQDLLEQLANFATASRGPRTGTQLAARTHVLTHSHIPSARHFAGVSVIPHDPEAFARALYAELHRCDEAGAELVIVEELSDATEWRALRDRLSRAAAEE